MFCLALSVISSAVFVTQLIDYTYNPVLRVLTHSSFSKATALVFIGATVPVSYVMYAQTSYTEENIYTSWKVYSHGVGSCSPYIRPIGTRGLPPPPSTTVATSLDM